MPDDEDEIHMVPVPRRHLKLVYQTLARAMVESSRAEPQEGEIGVNMTAPTRSGTLPFQHRNGIAWTQGNLEKLRRGIRCPAPIKMLDMAAAQPGHPVYFEDVRQELGQKDSTTRVQIGTLTKVIKRDFGVGYDDANWPVKVEWDKENGLMYYTMDDSIALAWNGSRGQEKEVTA